jgi:hypothetical protein
MPKQKCKSCETTDRHHFESEHDDQCVACAFVDGDIKEGESNE